MKRAALLLLAALTAPGFADEAAGWRFTHNIGGFVTGTGATPGMRGSSADYFRGACCGASAMAERKVPLEAWRGRRVRVSLRFKNDAKFARTTLGLEIDCPGRIIVANPQFLAGPDWQSSQFVLEVPADATTLALDLSLSGKGPSWVDAVLIEPVPENVPLSPNREIVMPPAARPQSLGPWWSSWGGQCCGDPSPYAWVGPPPVPVAVDIAPARK